MNKQEALQEIQRLSKEIEEHNQRYYVACEPIISDTEYDVLLQKLISLEKEYPEYKFVDSPTHRIGAKIITPLSVQHQIKMLSLDNTYSMQELQEWYARVVKGLGGVEPEVVVEFKIDGVSASCIYRQGQLSLASTRGDGQTGDDITHHMRVMPSVPLKLQQGRVLPEEVELRGEVYMSKKDFEKVNQDREEQFEEVFVNARNATSGSLKLLDASLSKKRRLSFFVHSFAKIDSSYEIKDQMTFLAMAKEWGFPVNEWTRLCSNIQQVMDVCHLFEQQRFTLPYDVDGVVIKVNSFQQQRLLGETMKSPKWAVAFKFAAMQATTVIKDIVVQVGRTGVLTPVALLEPVFCGGVTISKATLHNFDEVKRLNVSVGDRVLIERAGDVIPKIVKVVDSVKQKTMVSLIPSNCPLCRPDFIVKDALTVAHRCINPLCPRQLERRVVHFASRKAMDIQGLGERVVSQLIDKGYIKSVADIYHLTKEQLFTLDLFKDKKADNLLQAIEQSKNRSLASLIFALGIPNIGEKASLLIAKKFLNMEQLRKACYNDFLFIDEIGPVSAKAIETFLRQQEVGDILDDLARSHVNMKEQESFSYQQEYLTGKTFVFTGELEAYSRDVAESLVRSLGADVSSSVSSKTSFVVAGANAGSKLKKALTLGLTILDERQFKELLDEKK